MSLRIPHHAAFLTCALIASPALAQAGFYEDFEDAGTTLSGDHGPQGLLASGWEFRNQSEPASAGDWRRFADSYQGSWSLHVDRTVGWWQDDQSHASSWAILPAVPDQIAGDEVRFFFSTIPQSVLEPEPPSAHLEIRYSPSGSTDTGTGPDDFGDFTTLLADIPDPGDETWTEFRVPVPGSGRLAFRFLVPPNASEDAWWGSFHLDNLGLGPVVEGPPLPGPGETVHWTLEMSPISITEVTTIVAGGTVIVDAGVVVDLAPTATLTVDGDMIGVGVPGEPVTLRGFDRIDIFGALHLEEASAVDFALFVATIR